MDQIVLSQTPPAVNHNTNSRGTAFPNQAAQPDPPQSSIVLAGPQSIIPPQQPPVKMVPANEITSKPIPWLWDGYMAFGGLTIIAGQPGCGKTTLAIDLAAKISRGDAMPDGSKGRFGDVLIWSGEDSVAHVLNPRLQAANADLKRIKYIDSTQIDGKSTPFNPAADMQRLMQSIDRASPPQLLIIDPLIAAVKGDSHRNNETRNSLQPLIDFAENTGCAVLGITHLSKGTIGKDPLERINGSIAFGAVARSVLIAVSGPIIDRSEPDRILVRTKSNYGLNGGGICFKIKGATLIANPEIRTNHIEWGQIMKGDAKTLISAIEGDGGPVAPGILDEAKEFLQVELAGGEMQQKKLVTLAKEQGISVSTLRRAKAALGVQSKKVSECWIWKFTEPVNQVDQA